MTNKIIQKVATVGVGLMTTLAGCLPTIHAPQTYCPPKPSYANEFCDSSRTYKGTFNQGESTIRFEIGDRSCPDKPYKFAIKTPAGAAWIVGNWNEAHVAVADGPDKRVDISSGRFSENYDSPVYPDESFNCRNYGQGITCKSSDPDSENENDIARLVHKVVNEHLSIAQGVAKNL
ncbi:hypothetical protein HN953_00295 [Candidatus Woesearchaeota archaeon]|jgi:hypothetical protein|nr:hypothetical protein [Candidatus Woesearchaeota archaeon]